MWTQWAHQWDERSDGTLYGTPHSQTRSCGSRTFKPVPTKAVRDGMYEGEVISIVDISESVA